MLINVDKIQSLVQVSSNTYIRYKHTREEVMYADCEQNELINLIETTLHKAKRLEIASKLVGLYDDNTGCTINLEKCIKTAEELIKQNEAME
jgi:hypothetical protein